MEGAQPGTCWQDVDYRIKRWRTLRETLITDLETGVILTHLNLPLKTAVLPGKSHRPKAQRLSPYREIRRLREQMMDYLSTGHFCIYSTLLQESSGMSNRARRLINSIYRHIERSTDEAIAFHDKYDADEKSVTGEPSLPDDMTRLSLNMKQRFDLEDQLVTLLHETQQPH